MFAVNLMALIALHCTDAENKTADPHSYTGWDGGSAAKAF